MRVRTVQSTAFKPKLGASRGARLIDLCTAFMGYGLRRCRCVSAVPDTDLPPSSTLLSQSKGQGVTLLGQSQFRRPLFLVILNTVPYFTKIDNGRDSRTRSYTSSSTGEAIFFLCLSELSTFWTK